MGELLQAMRTFMFLHTDSDDELEVGVKEEFLRGTFSIMEFDENTKEMLDGLKAMFVKLHDKELGGLDVLQFETALTPVVSKGISAEHILKIFQKMDCSNQHAVSWKDFLDFAIEEHSKKLTMNETLDEMPFGPELMKVKTYHRDPIMRITFMPSVDPNTLAIDWSCGKYMILSREGQLSVWTATMRNIYYDNISQGDESNHPRNPSWYLDMVALYHNSYIAVATTSRDIAFFDYTRRGWNRKYRMMKLPHCVSTMSYWAGLETEKQAILLWGDTSGSVSLLQFDLSQRLPMFGIIVREGCTYISYKTALSGNYKGVNLRTFPRVHSDWVKQVQYVPESHSFLSCSNDGKTSMYTSPIDPTKKQPSYFKVNKGILCFDFSHQLNILACAGIDCSIWLYNPYIPSKVIAMMEGHIRPVIRIKINSKENYVLSIDLSKTIFMHNLTNQRCIQRIPGQSVRMGAYPITALYLNFERRMCLLANYSLAMLKRQRLEGLHVETRSHDCKLVGAMYSPEFQQVVSVCRGSMVRVWDITTGTRVMQFGMAHKKKSQGRWIPVEIECVALTENKRRLCTAAEGVVKIWNFNVGSVLRVLDMSNCPKITSIVMAKKQFYISGWCKVLNIFSDQKGEEDVKKIWNSKHSEDVLSLCVMEPNLIASGSYDGSVVVWSRETTDSYCKLSAIFGNKPELDASMRAGKGNAMADIADDQDDEDDEENQGEDAFMTIGKHLPKEGGWYRGLRALKKRQIEREKRRAAAEKKDFTAKYRKKKKKLNMQGLTLIYESAVECLVPLRSRKQLDAGTATIVAAGAECWIRFWSLHPRGGLLGQFTCTRAKYVSVRAMATDSKNEFLFTGDTIGLLRIFDIREFCNSDKLSEEDREIRGWQMKKDFVYQRLPFKPEEMLDTMDKLRSKRISAADASKPRKNLMSPKLLSSIRAHTEAIASLEFIEERNLILTASQDFTVRLWTKNCSYIGTFGETWTPIPRKVGPIVEKEPRIPKDLLRVGSAHTLGTLHNGKMPHWRTACYVVRRHIYEQRRERQIEEERQKKKEEKRARGEIDSDEDSQSSEQKPVSKILGKFYQPQRRYRGPMTTKDQGYPPLRMFKGICSPYNTTIYHDLHPMDPLYGPSTFMDIDSRRTGRKSKRVTRQMMNQFNVMTGSSERYGGPSKATSSNTLSKVDSSHETSHTNVSSGQEPQSHTSMASHHQPTPPVQNKNANKNLQQTTLLARRALPLPDTDRHHDVSANRSAMSSIGQMNRGTRKEYRLEDTSAATDSLAAQFEKTRRRLDNMMRRKSGGGNIWDSDPDFSSSDDQSGDEGEELHTLPDIELGDRKSGRGRGRVRFSHLL